MNIFQTIWSALTQSNEMLTNILLIPLAYVDAYVVMLFFTTLLNIQTTTKRKILYVLIFGIIANLVTFLIPSSYKIYINIIIWPIMICIIFKTHIIKALLAEIITMIISSVLESIFSNIFLLFFNITTKMIFERNTII